MKRSLNIARLMFLMIIISCKGTSQLPASETLFQSAAFTPVNSFTSGAEGPAVDKDGVLYAVNFAHEGTIGRLSTTGDSTVFR